MSYNPLESVPDTRCPVCQCPEENQTKCDKCGGESVCPKHGCTFCGKPEVIAPCSFEDAQYLGSSQDGVYFDVAEGPNGWYLSASYDCNSNHDCGELFTDDGPYATEAEAWIGGLNAAYEWLVEGHVRGWRKEYARLARKYQRMKSKQEVAK